MNHAIKRLRVIIGAAVFISTSQCYATSFNCAKASTPVEKKICAEKKLSALDSSLMNSYKKTAISGADRKALNIEQLAWLKNTRNQCQSSDCLEKVYQERISALDYQASGFAKYADGTVLNIESTEESVSVVARKNNSVTKVILKFSIDGGVGTGGKFEDVDKDGRSEISISTECGNYACQTAIYRYDTKSGNLVKVIEFFGSSIRKYKDYLIVNVRDTTSPYDEAFKLLNNSELKIKDNSGFSIVLNPDNRGTCEIATDSENLTDAKSYGMEECGLFFGDNKFKLIVSMPRRSG